MRRTSLGMLLVAFALLFMIILPQFRKKREILETAND